MGGGAVLQRKQLLIVSFPRNSGVYFYTNPCPHLPLALRGGVRAPVKTESGQVYWPLAVSARHRAKGFTS